ncbi:hypothetical protein CBL_09078 [Carabus blaptoides fortunei]
MFWWLIFVISCIVTYVKILKPLEYWKVRNVPGDRAWPILGSMGPMVFRTKSLAEWFEDLYKNTNTSFKLIGALNQLQDIPREHKVKTVCAVFCTHYVLAPPKTSRTLEINM